MVRPIVNYWVDFLILIAFIVNAGTGIVKFFWLPSGPGSSRTILLGMAKHTWSRIHDIAGFVFIILVLIHIVLHWNWIVCMTKGLFKKKKVCK